MTADPTCSEDTARRILARAIELDHLRGASYSLADLRGIVAELGVSEAALEQAVAELHPARDATWSAGHRMLLGTVAAAGTAVGALTGAVDAATSQVVSPLSMGLLLMVSGGVAVSGDYRQPVRGLLRFQLRNTTLWAGYAGAWALAAALAGGAGAITADVLAITATMGWTISTAVGGAVSGFQGWRGRARGATADVGAEPVKKRVARKLKRWIDVWASRVAIAGDAGAGTTSGALPT